MKKFRFTIDALQVQSFATTDQAVERRGTVRAHDALTDQVECPTADPNWGSCWNSCNESCQCSDTCDCESYDCTYECYSWYKPCSSGASRC